MATVVKNVVHYEPADWFTLNYQTSTNATRSRDASTQVRQESRYTVNETYNKTRWDQHDTNTKLSDRIDDIRKWKEILERTLRQLDEEIKNLSDIKELTEEELASMEIPLETAVECLTFRDSRQGTELTNDEAGKQLRREKEMIEGIKEHLQTNISQAFEQLCLLQEARQQIMLDLQDKNEALGIDVDQYNLSEKSPNISFKVDPLRIPKGMTTPQNWEDFSRYNKERADAEIRASARLREAIHHTIHQARNDLEAQRQSADYQLRKRIHETERAKTELEWQKKQLEDEICEMQADIRATEAAIKDKINPMKLAQTRLENRLTRPGVENCRDIPQYGLSDEVKQLEATKRILEEKLKQQQHALDGLEKNLRWTTREIENKIGALEIDNRCVDIRKRLAPKEQHPVDKNLLIRGLERDRAEVLPCSPCCTLLS